MFEHTTTKLSFNERKMMRKAVFFAVNIATIYTTSQYISKMKTTTKKFQQKLLYDIHKIYFMEQNSV